MRKTNFSKTLALCLGSLALIFSLNYLALAWTEPGVTAPGDNVFSPINVGNTTQTKTGGLQLNGILYVRGAFNADGGSTAGNGLNIISNGNVGIGITSPSQKLDVNGQARAIDFCTTAGKCLSTVGGGGSSKWTASGANIYNNNQTGNVGIGTMSPSQRLDVNGQAKATDFCTTAGKCLSTVGGGGGGGITKLTQGSGIILNPNPITSIGTISADTTYIQKRVTGTCAAGSSIRVINENGTVACENDDVGGGGGGISGSGIVNYLPKFTAGTSIGNSQIYDTSNNNNNGNVGIGKTSPTEKLDVNGQIKGIDVCTIYGKCLSAMSNYWTLSGNSLYPSTSYNVGIGIVTPAQKLDVNGKILMRNETVSSDPSNTVVTKGYLDSKIGGLIIYRMNKHCFASWWNAPSPQNDLSMSPTCTASQCLAGSGSHYFSLCDSDSCVPSTPQNLVCNNTPVGRLTGL